MADLGVVICHVLQPSDIITEIIFMQTFNGDVVTFAEFNFGC